MVPVDDPHDVPEDTRNLVREMDKEFNRVERVRSVQDTAPAQLEAEMNDIIARFDSLGGYLMQQRDEDHEDPPDANATPVASATATASPLATARAMPGATDTAVPGASAVSATP